MDYFDFYNKIHEELTNIGFDQNQYDEYQLATYLVIVKDDKKDMYRIGIEIINTKNIDNDDIDAMKMFKNGDIIRSTTWFNLKNDTDKELNRRFKSAIINRLIKLPDYNYYLRNKKIDKIK